MDQVLGIQLLILAVVLLQQVALDQDGWLRLSAIALVGLQIDIDDGVHEFHADVIMEHVARLWDQSRIGRGR